jgi:hypothetical protein
MQGLWFYSYTGGHFFSISQLIKQEFLHAAKQSINFDVFYGSNFAFISLSISKNIITIQNPGI